MEAEVAKKSLSDATGKKIRITTKVKKSLADLYTPVGVYLRLRDRFRDTILLESTDSHVAENSYSFIGINAIAGIEVRNKKSIAFKFPGQNPEKAELKTTDDLKELLWSFMQRFDVESEDPKAAQYAQGLFGYFTFDAVQFFEKINFKEENDERNKIPVARYRLYQYVIAINHYKNELMLLENQVAGVESEVEIIESLDQQQRCTYLSVCFCLRRKL